jgi:hypothetical protein
MLDLSREETVYSSMGMKDTSCGPSGLSSPRQSQGPSGRAGVGSRPGAGLRPVSGRGGGVQRGGAGNEPVLVDERGLSDLPRGA